MSSFYLERQMYELLGDFNKNGCYFLLNKGTEEQASPYMILLATG